LTYVSTTNQIFYIHKTVDKREHNGIGEDNMFLTSKAYVPTRNNVQYNILIDMTYSLN